MSCAVPPILEAGVAHLELLAELHAAAFPSEPWSAEALGALLCLPGSQALLAGAVGFVLLRSAADEAELLTLAVLPSARRRGVGRRLVAEAARRAALAGAERLLLEVAEDNQAALGLYQALGFGRVGLRRGYYRRPDRPLDALVLALALPA